MAQSEISERLLLDSETPLALLFSDSMFAWLYELLGPAQASSSTGQFSEAEAMSLMWTEQGAGAQSPPPSPSLHARPPHSHLPQVCHLSLGARSNPHSLLEKSPFSRSPEYITGVKNGILFLFMDNFPAKIKYDVMEYVMLVSHLNKRHHLSIRP